MRTTMTLLLAVLLSFGFAVTSFADILGSAHDLSGTGAGEPGADEICIYCHTPHNAIANTVAVPLWSMTVSAATTGYTPYSSTTFDAESTLTDDTLLGPSRVCMTCHDGTIAMNSAIVGAAPVTMTDAFAGSPAILGTDLSNDHPIGFDYTVSATVDLEIEAVGSPLGTAPSTIEDALYLDTIMTCASCHDVHEAGASGYFLIQENAASALCLACHMK